MNPRKRKTYQSLLGMIFLGGNRALFVAGRQRVAKERMTKNCKITKKSVIFLQRTPLFFFQSERFFEAKSASCSRCDG
jgi:hypothetical protein